MGLKILQFGDVHLPLPPGALRSPEAWRPRRIPAIANYFLLRGRHYAAAGEKLDALRDFLRREGADWIFYAGDSVGMGLDAEFRAAAPRLTAVFREARCGTVAVPGNHDFYTYRSVGDFRRRMEAAGSHVLPGAPVVRFLAEDSAVVAFETARPHFFFWHSSGYLAPETRDALATLLDDPRLAGLERVFLLTHYPPDDDDPYHGFPDAKPLAEILANRPNLVFLHGHVHKVSRRTVSFGSAEVPVFCSGSLSKAGVESFWLHEIEEGRLLSRRGRWTGSAWTLDPPE
ncbi:MAG: metallophosphoesterase [Kiritimatiellae bacterium]|nr:metallophosphoesterase [Kiritimatiellia bacterium]